MHIDILWAGFSVLASECQDVVGYILNLNSLEWNFSWILKEEGVLGSDYQLGQVFRGGGGGLKGEFAT